MNRVISYSTDGRHFLALPTSARADYRTADRLGLTVGSNSGQHAAMLVRHWVVE